MTQHTDKELELQAAEPAAAAIAPTDGERRDDPGFATPVDAIGVSKRVEEQIEPADDDTTQDDEKAVRPTLAQTQSHATTASIATMVSVARSKRPWYKKWNPLRWGAIPPIPKEPTVSREASAGFWSRLTFTWMGPLMTVSNFLKSTQ